MLELHYPMIQFLISKFSLYDLLEGVGWSHRDSGFCPVDSGLLVLDMKVPDSSQ